MQQFRFLFLCLLLLLSGSFLAAQQDSTKKKLSDIITVRGYVKYMNTASIFDIDNVVSQNLIHNRINFRGYFGDQWTAGLEVRNRVFYGESVRLTPGFGDLLEIDPGLVDMNWTLVNGNAFVVHSTFDRAWLNYTKGSVLFNSGGLTRPVPLAGGGAAVFGDISAKNLMPSKYTLFGMVSATPNPLLNLGISTIYAPGMNFVLLMPTAGYSLSANWEIMGVAQTFLGEQAPGGLAHLGSGVFVRVKWSY